MRQPLTSVLVAGCVWSTVLAFHAHSESATIGKACGLLPRDLVMKVVPDARKKELERAKAEDDPFAEDLKAAGRPVRPGMSCKYGPILLELDGLAKPDAIRNGLRARTKPYDKFEPVAGVGDAAFFRANSAWASMYVWTGSHHFTIEFGEGPTGDDTLALKPNVIELAKGIVAGLR